MGVAVSTECFICAAPSFSHYSSAPFGSLYHSIYSFTSCSSVDLSTLGCSPSRTVPACTKHYTDYTECSPSRVESSSKLLLTGCSFVHLAPVWNPHGLQPLWCGDLHECICWSAPPWASPWAVWEHELQCPGAVPAFFLHWPCCPQSCFTHIFLLLSFSAAAQCF